MGQYYIATLVNPELSSKPGVIEAYDGGLYTSRKLTVHSLYFNIFTETICKMLLNNAKKVYWIGDYADKDDVDEMILTTARESECQLVDVDETFASMRGYCLVNLTKNVFVDLGRNYIKSASCNCNDYDCVCHPLPILTAVGNGKGGGDYCGINQHLVGSWAGDNICLMKYNVNLVGLKDVTDECIFVENYELKS